MGIETTSKVLNKRLIIAVDTNTCTGCGDCVNACLTGALQLVNDKATLIDEKICDGFGSCIAACKQDAIRLEVRKAEDFNWAILEKISFDALMAKLRSTSMKTDI